MGMHVRLTQRDHPDPRVNDMAITHRDPYFNACWQGVVHDWTRHLTARVATLTADGDKHLTFDDFSRQLANGSAARSTREQVVKGAMEEATGRGLGSLTWQNGEEVTINFCAYRNVPLVPDEERPRLTDAELQAHARAIFEANRRLTATGQPEVGVPEWVREKWPRINPGYQAAPAPGMWRDDPSAAVLSESTATARLDALRERPSSERHSVSQSTARASTPEAMQAYLDALRKGPAFAPRADGTPAVVPPGVQQDLSL